jgi:2-oxoglutarate dehydrogenase E1 component
LQEPLSSKDQLLYSGRAPAAAPATGIAKMHAEQQTELVDAALRADRSEETMRQTQTLRFTGAVAKKA